MDLRIDHDPHTSAVTVNQPLPVDPSQPSHLSVLEQSCKANAEAITFMSQQLENILVHLRSPIPPSQVPRESHEDLLLPGSLCPSPAPVVSQEALIPPDLSAQALHSEEVYDPVPSPGSGQSIFSGGGDYSYKDKVELVYHTLGLQRPDPVVTPSATVSSYPGSDPVSKSLQLPPVYQNMTIYNKYQDLVLGSELSARALEPPSKFSSFYVPSDPLWLPKDQECNKQWTHVQGSPLSNPRVWLSSPVCRILERNSRQLSAIVNLQDRFIATLQSIISQAAASTDLNECKVLINQSRTLLESLSHCTGDLTERTIFQTCQLTLARRDSLIATMNRAVRNHVKADLRASPFVGQLLFSAEPLEQARRQVEAAKEQGYGTYLRQAPLDVSKFSSVNKGKGKQIKKKGFTNKKKPFKKSFRFGSKFQKGD